MIIRCSPTHTESSNHRMHPWDRRWRHQISGSISMCQVSTPLIRTAPHRPSGRGAVGLVEGGAGPGNMQPDIHPVPQCLFPSAKVRRHSCLNSRISISAPAILLLLSTVFPYWPTFDLPSSIRQYTPCYWDHRLRCRAPGHNYHQSKVERLERAVHELQDGTGRGESAAHICKRQNMSSRRMGYLLSRLGALLLPKTSIVDAFVVGTALQRYVVEDDIGGSRGREAEEERSSLHVSLKNCESQLVSQTCSS